MINIILIIINNNIIIIIIITIITTILSVERGVFPIVAVCTVVEILTSNVFGHDLDLNAK